MNIDYYLTLVAKALKTNTVADIDALDAYVADYPDVVDAAYKAAGPMTYDPVAGIVYNA
jgi:hypothetical protein